MTEEKKVPGELEEGRSRIAELEAEAEENSLRMMAFFSAMRK